MTSTSITKPVYLQKINNIIQLINIPGFLDSQKVVNALEDFTFILGYKPEKLFFNFVSKSELYKMNKKYLGHNTHTDIISFDYSKNNQLVAEFFISMWAIKQSAIELSQSIEKETLRTLSHGVLHCMGYNDKTAKDKIEMRNKEDQFIAMFHVKHNRNV